MLYFEAIKEQVDVETDPRQPILWVAVERLHDHGS